MAIAASAALDLGSINDVGSDIQEVFGALAAQVDPDELKAVVVEFFNEQDIPADADVADIPANAGEALALMIADRFGFADTDFANTLQGALSNDFVSFLAGIYIDVPPVVTTTEPPKPPTGDSSMIAIAAFAALAVAGGAAFVILKKKED
jgi:LPXTG-motif cell wall-anchored protein